ncbi:MAG: glycosyltransferase family 4 protein [Mycobacterium sp.]|nr:glycosyltransferase family 4 protein [Mycobacterium sp.]
MSGRDPVGGARPPVLAIGPFPPFVGGAAKNTAIICDAFESRGACVRRLPTNTTRVRAEHVLSPAIYSDRILGFLGNLRQIVSARDRDAGATVYLVADGGLGVAFSAAYARAGARLFPRLVVHHRSYNHVRRRSALMAQLMRTSPDKTLHVFLDPVMEEQFKRVYSAEVRSMYVPNAATCDLEPPSSGTELPRGRGATVGFLSNLVEDKGFDVVAEALPKLADRLGPGSRFLIAGRPVGDQNAARLEELQRTLGARLEYFGEVSGQAKTDFFRSCDVFVFPTRFSQEAQPNVLYEALAGGAAIVSTRWAGVPWVLGDTVSRLIEPGPDRAGDLVEAVAELVASDEFPDARRRQMAAFTAKKSDADVRYNQLLNYVVEGLV